jgi:hypothetical protein
MRICRSECHIDTAIFSHINKRFVVPTSPEDTIKMTSVRRPKVLLLRLLNSAILILCLASIASGDPGRLGQGVGCGPCPRLVAAARSSALLPGSSSIIVGPIPILGCRRMELCSRGSSLRSDAVEGFSSILLSLRGGGATPAAARSKPKSAPNPRKDKGGGGRSSVADGRQKASMSASVFNLVNNVAGAFPGADEAGHS